MLQNRWSIRGKSYSGRGNFGLNRTYIEIGTKWLKTVILCRNVVTKYFQETLDSPTLGVYNVVTMFVATRKRNYKGKIYTSSQIVEGYRNKDGKVRQRTLLDISKLGPDKIAAIKAAFQGKSIVDWDALDGLQSLDFGIPHVVIKTLESLELPEILDEEGREHLPTIVAMIANRIDAPCAKYSLKHWAKNTALSHLLGADEKKFHHNECYSALDYLEENQRFIEDELYARREQPARLFFYDITSTYFEGRKAELSAYGYSRDHRGDRRQVVIGLVTGAEGLPICVEVFEGNTRDCSTVIGKIDDIKNRFQVERACFVGDRGMRSSTNIEHIKKEGLDFIFALNHSEVLRLADKHGPVQLGLFDERNLVEVEIDGRRLVVCRNPIAGADTKRRRNELLKLTEDWLKKIEGRVKKGRLRKPDAIRRAVDRCFGKWKMEKFFRLEIGDGEFSFERDVEKIKAAAMLDGVYVIETTLGSGEMDAKEIQRTYKFLRVVEEAFRCAKNDLDIRPVYHWRERRIRGHVFMCFLAYMVEQKLRLGLKRLPEEQQPEWKEVLSELRGWRRVSIQDRPGMKAHYPGFTPEISYMLNAWEIPPPV